MTDVILENISCIDDLLLFSKAYKEGKIIVNVSKIARHFKKDRKTVTKYLNGKVPKKTRKRVKYLDQFRDYIYEVLNDEYASFDYKDHLFKYLKREKGITCSRSSFTRYITEDEAIAIGYSVAIKRNSVYFIKFNKLINTLKTAYNEGTIEKRVKNFFKYKLLIIDEVGFTEISPLEAKLFFQLIDLRYSKKSTIITSNMTFEKWPNILGEDEMITKAILDRLLHHSFLFNISGPSYRIKDKLNFKKK